MKFHLVLGLVYVFLDGIKYAIEFMFVKFARIVKVGVTASIPEDRIRIQNGFHKLDIWSRNKQNLKKDKCQVLHLCRNNLLKYRTDNNWLGKTSSEKGLRSQ